MAYKDYRDVIRQMERDMQMLTDEVFRGFFDVPMGAARFWHPAIDVYENDTHLLIKTELAGIRAEDIQVSLSPDGRVLTLSGVRKEDDDERKGRLRGHQLEVYFGPFERSIALPTGVPVDRDRITAVYRDGFLMVKIHKRAIEHTVALVIPIHSEEEVEDDCSNGAKTPTDGSGTDS